MPLGGGECSIYDCVESATECGIKGGIVHVVRVWIRLSRAVDVSVAKEEAVNYCSIESLADTQGAVRHRNDPIYLSCRTHILALNKVLLSYTKLI